jgi:hypothetical protein
MLRQKARDYFLGREGSKLNCAQSIVAADDPKNKSLLAESAKYGGGKAPEGWCGPAYIAFELLKNKELVERKYVKSAGSVKCAEIRQKGMITCVNCVELGVELIEKNRKPK